MPYLAANIPINVIPSKNIALLHKTHMVVIEFLDVLANKLQEELEKERGCECEDCEYAHGLRDGRRELATELTNIFAEYTEKAEALLNHEES
jgi:hypothetical protein